jgi:hypothetical protein
MYPDESLEKSEHFQKKVARVSHNRTFSNQKSAASNQKSAAAYDCVICLFSTKKKSDLSKHYSTKKHKERALKIENDENMVTSQFCRHCNKEYRAKSSLWYHEKKCIPMESSQTENHIIVSTQSNETAVEYCQPINDNEKDALIIELLKQNQDIQKQNQDIQQQILDIVKEGKPNTVTNITTTNNQFNMNVFLNEKCKDAINITDFVNSLQVSMSDFEATGRLGYAEGISQIIINGLRKIDVHKRPVHCTDSKRETLYIKDKDMWEKENPGKTKLSKAVKAVANKNMNMFQEWQTRYPESIVNNTKENQQLVKIMLAVLGGRTPEEEKKYEEKIMRNIAKEVFIDKTTL